MFKTELEIMGGEENYEEGRKIRIFIGQRPSGRKRTGRPSNRDEVQVASSAVPASRSPLHVQDTRPLPRQLVSTGRPRAQAPPQAAGSGAG